MTCLLHGAHIKYSTVDYKNNKHIGQYGQKAGLAVQVAEKCFHNNKGCQIFVFPTHTSSIKLLEISRIYSTEKIF